MLSFRGRTPVIPSPHSDLISERVLCDVHGPLQSVGRPMSGNPCGLEAFFHTTTHPSPPKFSHNHLPIAARHRAQCLQLIARRTSPADTQRQTEPNVSSRHRRPPSTSAERDDDGDSASRESNPRPVTDSSPAKIPRQTPRNLPGTNRPLSNPTRHPEPPSLQRTERNHVQNHKQKPLLQLLPPPLPRAPPR